MKVVFSQHDFFKKIYVNQTKRVYFCNKKLSIYFKYYGATLYHFEKKKNIYFKPLDMFVNNFRYV